MTLGDIISLEKLQYGTVTERIGQIDVALKEYGQYSLSATAEEFRIVADGLTHENQAVRAGSAGLLKVMTTRATDSIVNKMIYERKEPGQKSPEEDYAWYKSVYYLGDRNEFPDTDAYKAWKLHFPGRRCPDSFFSWRNYQKSFSGSFTLAGFVQTQDITTLRFAMQEEIDRLTLPMTNECASALQGIVEFCPDSSTRELAARLLDLDKRKQPSH